MKPKTYEKIHNSISQSESLTKSIKIADRVLTKLAYVAYPLLLIYLFVCRDDNAIRAILVPAISFVALSVFRYVYNAPRPYEKLGIPSILKKDTKGKSFPSRHVFSSFIIAVTIYYFFPAAGVVLLILSAVMAAVRVLGGVHFLRDVVWGALIGVGCGIIGFYLI
jgi:membrane-associated phospholipid phosphatase